MRKGYHLLRGKSEIWELFDSVIRKATRPFYLDSFHNFRRNISKILGMIRKTQILGTKTIKNNIIADIISHNASPVTPN